MYIYFLAYYRDISKNNPSSAAFYDQVTDVSNPVNVTDLKGFNDSEIILFPTLRSNLYQWCAFIRGPADTPFENARFRLKIQVPQTYPHSPPTVHFATTICHPNIHFDTGVICLDVLKDNWTPSWSLESVCRAIIVLLGAPEPSSPLNCDAAILLRENEVRTYWSLARMYTIEHAEMLPIIKKNSSKSSSSSSSSKTNDANSNTHATTAATMTNSRATVDSRDSGLE